MHTSADHGSDPKSAAGTARTTQVLASQQVGRGRLSPRSRTSCGTTSPSAKRETKNARFFPICAVFGCQNIRGCICTHFYLRKRGMPYGHYGEITPLNYTYRQILYIFLAPFGNSRRRRQAARGQPASSRRRRHSNRLVLPCRSRLIWHTHSSGPSSPLRSLRH